MIIHNYTIVAIVVSRTLIRNTVVVQRSPIRYHYDLFPPPPPLY